MKIIALPIFIFIQFICINIQAQIVINEYSCSNWALTADNYGDHEDWIELYNPTFNPVNIGGYYLSDKISQPTKWKFPAGVMINANSYLVVWASGRDEVSGGNYHTNFRITQTKLPSEEIVLSNASGTIIDQVPITVTQKHNSFGRVPDGGVNRKIFLTPSPGSSNVSLSAKDRYASRPSFDISPGFFSSAVTVSITTTESNSTIHYTTNGSEPTATSPTYSSPVSLDSTSVLKAITIPLDPTVQKSFVSFGTYFINNYHTLPVVSIAADDLLTLANGNSGLKPEGSIEYFNINRIRKTAGYGEFNSHGQDSWANDQRSLDYIMRDEFGYNYALQEQLFNLTQRDEFQRVILRAAGDDNYPAAHHTSNEGSAHLRDAYVQNLAKTGGLDLDVRIGTKAIVYINGNYWGVYDLREIPDDHDYTNYYYGQGKYSLQYIETWGGTWAEYGGQQALDDWSDFHDTVMAGNMNDPAFWNYVTSTLDVKSLVDYVIVNSVTVCSDWLNYNTGWWRGMDSTGSHKKWGYILWDNDAVFGFYVNYTGIPDKGPFAAPCNVEGNISDPKGHIDLLNKLRENPSFNNYYISRYIDLSNTVFSCDVMLNTLDSLVAVIDPEMSRHAQRWFGTYTEWQTNVQLLRDFISQRCTAFGGLMDSCYNLTGPYPIYITEDPIGTGKIQINSLTITDFPWTGNYHGGIPVYLKAIPDSLNSISFDRWETQFNPIVPSVYLVNAEMNVNGPDTLIAHFIHHTTGIPEIKNQDFDVKAFPAAFSSETTIEFNNPDGKDISVVLYSTLGKPVMYIKGKSQKGLNQFVLNLSGKGIASGTYILNFKSEKINKSVRLIYAGE